MRLLIDPDDFIRELLQMYVNGKSDEDVRKFWSSLLPNDIDEEEKFEPTDAQLKNLRSDFVKAIENKRLQKCEEVLEWFHRNQHLSQPSWGMVFRFLWGAKDDVEKCKKNIQKYYGIRGADDEIFSNRDPVSDAARQLHSVSSYACLPRFTPELYRITLTVLTDEDVHKFNAYEWAKRLFYIADLRVKNDFSLGEVIIYDLKGFSLQHVLRFPVSLLRKLATVFEGALPSRIKQIHFVNCPPFVDKIQMMLKPFVKEKINNRIHIHLNGVDSLYKHISNDLLPNDYGGELESLKIQSDKWIRQFEENREWFAREEKQVKRMYLEGKKSGKLFLDCGELFGMEGSFKKLIID